MRCPFNHSICIKICVDQVRTNADANLTGPIKHWIQFGPMPIGPTRTLENIHSLRGIFSIKYKTRGHLQKVVSLALQTKPCRLSREKKGGKKTSLFPPFQICSRFFYQFHSQLFHYHTASIRDAPLSSSSSLLSSPPLLRTSLFLRRVHR